jgi:hypothetical protein
MLAELLVFWSSGARAEVGKRGFVWAAMIYQHATRGQAIAEALNMQPMTWFTGKPEGSARKCKELSSACSRA